MRKANAAPFVRVDYGNGVRRYFSREQIANLKRIGIPFTRIVRATREWAESMPSMNRDLSFRR